MAPFRRVRQLADLRDVRHAAAAMVGTLQVTSDEEGGEIVEGDTGFTAHVEGVRVERLRTAELCTCISCGAKVLVQNTTDAIRILVVRNLQNIQSEQ